MFKSHLKVAFRNLGRNKLSAFINVGGLAIGMTVAILLGLWIYDELSFNTYHTNYSRIVKLYDHQTHRGEANTNETLPIPLGTTIRQSFSSDLKHVVMVRELEEHVLATGDKLFTEDGNFMEADAPDMLSLRMIQGSRSGLKSVNSILLSQTLSEKLFGKVNVIGKRIRMDNDKDVAVTGVYQDIPNNSNFHSTSFIAPFAFWGANKTDWGNYNVNILAELNPNVDLAKLSEKVSPVLTQLSVTPESKHTLFLQPMSKWHLYSQFENHTKVTSDQLKFVWFYAIIGIFVLLLACINFMNLSTARSEKRAREVGVRKAIGSLRIQLVQQFYTESFLIAFFSLLLSLCMVQLLLPWFNSVADKGMLLPWLSPSFWLMAIVFTSLTALLAGSYPALYLSSFNAIKVLKGGYKAGKWASLPRRMLVVLQFTVSIALIIGTIIVYQQLQYAKGRPVGYSQRGLITLQMKSPELQGKQSILRQEMLKTGMVTEVATANYGITDTRGWNGGFKWQGKDKDFDPSFNTIYVSADYGKTLGWEMTKGRDFDANNLSDSSGIILNESALALMGISNPVGTIVRWAPGWKEEGNYKILGVVKDMVKGSPYKPTYPSVIFLGSGNWYFFQMKHNVSASEALPKMAAAFKGLAPAAPFDYKFVDEEYGEKFAAEERIGKLATVFAILAILISCLGLFGLASFVAEQRTREIGVRKVLGASVFNCWRMLSRDFLLLVFISCLIAGPIAWYFLNRWLQQYEYRIGISWSVFAMAGTAALLITMLTVSFQAIRAGMASPVKSLRSE